MVRRALPDAQAVSLQSGWPTPVERRRLSQPDRRRRAGLRRDPALPDGAGLPVRGRRAADRARRARAAAGGGPRLRRRRQAVRRARRGGGPEDPGGRPRVAGQGRDRQEGPGAGPVVRRVRPAARSPPSSRCTAGGRPRSSRSRWRPPRRSTAAMARAEEAMRVAHRLRPGRGRTTSRWTRPTRWWPSGEASPGVLFTAIPAVVCIGIVVGRHRDHEHHADDGERAHPRDRHPEVARRDPRATSGASSWSRRCAATLGGLAGRARRAGALAAAVSSFTPLPARVTLWSVARGPGTRRGRRHPLRRLSRRPRRPARSRSPRCGPNDAGSISATSARASRSRSTPSAPTSCARR